MTKIFVLLLHGTWAGPARWTHSGSPLRVRLQARLEELGYETVRMESFQWNAKNRWNARTEVTKAINEYFDGADEDRPWSEWDFLIVAHSHGGNIATDVVRERVRRDPDCPIRGVVCLNTPFLTRQLKSSNGYLLVWTFVATLIAALLWRVPSNDALCEVPKLIQPFLRTASIERGILALPLMCAGAATGLLYLLSRIVRAQIPKRSWTPRPNVLCLSCPDDEAITFLGLGEGIANLPQLLLHPLALIAMFIGSALLRLSDRGLSWCGGSLACWMEHCAFLSWMLVSWLTAALVGGVLGTLFVSLLFGLSLRQALESLVSRVLVSYAPLLAANSFFRGISELPLKVSPFQLVHSRIYESPETVDEIHDWLKQL